MCYIHGSIYNIRCIHTIWCLLRTLAGYNTIDLSPSQVPKEVQALIIEYFSQKLMLCNKSPNNESHKVKF